LLKTSNNIHVRGYVFSHNLEKAVYGPNSKKAGQEYIRGNVTVATDDQALNVVQVNFSFVDPTWAKSGKPNDTYAVLESIINTQNTYQNVGTQAMKIRIDGNFEVNDYWSKNNNTMVSSTRLRGVFAHTMLPSDNLGDTPATFDADMLVTKADTREYNDGNVTFEISGFVFDFRNALIPLTLVVRDELGQDFFNSADISQSNPMFLNVDGVFTSEVIELERENDSTEYAFGAPKVVKTKRSVRRWELLHAKNPYDFGDESVMTMDEFKSALQARTEKVANEEQRAKSRGGIPTVPNKPKATPQPIASDDDIEF
jgi:hypothetical protein